MATSIRTPFGRTIIVLGQRKENVPAFKERGGVGGGGTRNASSMDRQNSGHEDPDLHEGQDANFAGFWLPGLKKDRAMAVGVAFG